VIWLLILLATMGEPKNCAEITGQPPGSCAYERCVCTTDPDPEARREHCNKARGVCPKEPDS
jgi:hypothetical protein